MTVRTCIYLILLLITGSLSAQINRDGIPEIVNYPPEVTRGSEKKLLSSGKTLDIDRGTIQNDTHILYQIKADHMPIGISEKEHQFTSTFIEEQEAIIYLFSDGYVDQFGGPPGKKFMSKNYKKLLLGMYDLPMEEQKKRLDEELISWMGDVSQIDDILVIGIKMKSKQLFSNNPLSVFCLLKEKC